jgi:hypothetical protein
VRVRKEDRSVVEDEETFGLRSCSVATFGTGQARNKVSDLAVGKILRLDSLLEG